MARQINKGGNAAESQKTDRRSYDIVVLRVREKGGFDVDIHGIKLYNLRLVNGNKGIFVSMPADKDRNGKYWHRFYIPMDEATSDKLIDDVMSIYEGEYKRSYFEEVE